MIRDIRSSTPNGIGGNITLTASQGQILVTPTGRGQTVQTVDNQDDTTVWKLRAESSNGLAGDVTLTALGNIQSPNIQASSVNKLPSTDFADISITSSTGTVFIENATLNTTNAGNSFAGDISISGRDIQITDNSSIKSQGIVGRINLTANDGKVTISNNSVVDTQTTNGVTTTLKPSQGEGISIKAGQIEINNNSSLTAQTNSSAPPGSITLDATGSVDITNGSSIRNTVSDNANVQQVVADYTPTISLKGISVNIINSGINASTFGIGNASNVIINARDLVTFDNANAFTTVEDTGIGQGGNIEITADSLFVRNGAQLQTLTKGQGNAGNITINARNQVTFDNANAFATVEQGGKGKGGDIRISIPTGSLFVTNGAQLQALTKGQGDAGSIIINASDSVNISGTSPISGLSSALFTSTEGNSRGAGGNITVGSEIRPNLFSFPRIKRCCVLYKHCQ
ncbi:hypothetical protein [Nostoc sp.]|uniref:hypothetical protein n=1 Tax=Nostoc sp. TaxID=1180 RepID=UPI002FF51515